MIAVREARLPDELPLVLDVHNRNRERPATLSRLEWGYLRNPAGAARAWLALDTSQGRAVGCGAVHPRRLTIDGQRVDAWTTGDLSVLQEFRGHGIALRIRKAACDEIDGGAARLIFTHPNPAAVSVHRRAGSVVLGRMVRVLKVLEVPKGPRWLRAMSGWPLRLWGADPPLPAGTTLDEVPRGAIGHEFGALHADVAPRLGIAVERSAEYLTWRFENCPHEDISLLALRAQGRLRGYLAFAVRDGYFAVKDWLTASPDEVGVLFAGLARHARAQGAAWLSVTALEDHPHLPQLHALGFFERTEETTAMVYAPAGSPLREAATDRRRWFMTAGDRDV